MLRKLIVGLCLLASAILLMPSAAEARHMHGYRRAVHHLSHRYSQHLVRRHWHYLNRRVAMHRAPVQRARLPGPCYTAAAMGGPCGCWTAWNLLGVLDHVWHGHNLWMAWDWASFPRALPGPGTAAVWKNHSHVAPVARDNGDGSVTVRDYWGTHRVSLAQVIIVDPSGGARRRGSYRVTLGWPL